METIQSQTQFIIYYLMGWSLAHSILFAISWGEITALNDYIRRAQIVKGRPSEKQARVLERTRKNNEIYLKVRNSDEKDN